MFRYCLTIFLSAFLLFQVQPMIARFILPWFGGTAAVWTTCMMFFQTLLLLGYLYAHLMRRFASPRTTWLLHLGLLLIAAATLSVVPGDSLRPSGSENLTLGIIGVLGLTIGVPFFVLSSTGPLIQAWQSSSHRGQSPYRLYALSNLGSILALVTYPFLVERYFSMNSQALFWTIGFYCFSITCCWSGWQTLHLKNWSEAENAKAKSPQEGRINLSRPGLVVTLVWFVLAATASIILLATTNLLCQEVASIPFLWILPLSLYLLSFIICFDRPAIYQRLIFMPLVVGGAIVAVGLVHLGLFTGLAFQIIALSTVCFSASMVCHGELERSKPPPDYLTGFYLVVAFGGAAGGIFVCILAPQIFTGFLEFHVGLIVSLLVVLCALIWPTGQRSKPIAPSLKFLKYGAAMSVFVVLAIVLSSAVYFLDPSYQEGLIFRGRNEYGLVSVVEKDGYRQFINGRVEHGGQKVGAEKEMEHISYYVPESGVGVAFESHREISDDSLNVAVLGLGAGAMATWLEPGDRMVFYEINPMVVDIAENHFSFLRSSKGETRVKLGDGRLQLQNEMESGKSERYDLIFIDAFSSDSIPIHLLTAECFKVYLDRLKPDGVLVAHITNRFIDLQPVILDHSLRNGLTPILVDYHSPDGKLKTRWVLMTKNENFKKSEKVKSLENHWTKGLVPVQWTDDYSSVAALLNWSVGIDIKKMNADLEDSKTINPAEVDGVGRSDANVEGED
ncbi:spermidine synthase [Mariniblastus sp.]|nr:spermidine synthase [bacterium]MDA7928910.1 spermidine synthase [Mariniblastus sp.]MDB4564351.1 spermidine synthase [Mariniblastus sp.]